MTPNVSFAFLDAAIIRGRADDPVVGTMTHARLLEEVAALAGVLWHLGVRPGKDWFTVLSGTARLHLGDRVVLVEAGQVEPLDLPVPHQALPGLRPGRRAVELLQRLDLDHAPIMPEGCAPAGAGGPAY